MAWPSKGSGSLGALEFAAGLLDSGGSELTTGLALLFSEETVTGAWLLLGTAGGSELACELALGTGSAVQAAKIDEAKLSVIVLRMVYLHKGTPKTVGGQLGAQRAKDSLT